jgi:hypothetical protein
MRGLLFFLLTLLPAAAQEFTAATLARHALTNESVITLAKAGFDELFIYDLIRTSRARFDTTVAGLVTLKQAGVSEDLIRVMVAHDVRAYPIVGEAAAPAADAAPAFMPFSLRTPAAPAAQTEACQTDVAKHWWGTRRTTICR